MSESGGESGSQTRLAGLEDQSLIARPTPLLQRYFKFSKNMVGHPGFEPGFFRSQGERIDPDFPNARKKEKAPKLLSKPGAGISTVLHTGLWVVPREPERARLRTFGTINSRRYGFAEMQ
jgi:hypothetical protein